MSIYKSKYSGAQIEALLESVSNKADRSEIPSIEGLASEAWVSGNYQPKGNYLTAIPDEYVTDTELAAKGYATETYVQGLIGDINSALAAIIALQ